VAKAAAALPLAASLGGSAAAGASLGGAALAAAPAAISLGSALSKGGAAAPAPVDPGALAQAQGQSNIQTAQAQAMLNNISTFSPFGASQYMPFIDPQTGMASGFKLDQTLNPAQQALFNQQTDLASKIAGAGGTAVGQGGTLGTMGMGLIGQGAGWAPNVQPTANFGNVPNIPVLTPSSFQTSVTGGAGGQALPGVQTGVGVDSSTLVKQAQDAAYKSQTQYLDPQFSQARQQLTQQLADQGLQPGTEAYDRAQGDFNRQQQQAYQSAQNQAVAAGNAQEQALFGQAVTGGQFANQAQQQMFGQGFNLANLYNQAVTGAAAQNAVAQQGNLQVAQAQFQDPMAAMQAMLGAGTGLYGTGLGAMGAALPAVGAAPTWPTSIPTMGGQQNVVPPTNLGAVTNAATAQNQLAQQGYYNRANTLLGGVNLGSQALFGQPIGGAGSGGGLINWLSNLGGGGGQTGTGGMALPSAQTLLDAPSNW
jgi:hypothetical protein